MSESMDCDQLVALATEYLDRALDPQNRARFDLHRAECSGCDNYLQQLLRTIDTLGNVPDEPIDPEFRARLMDAFRQRE